jgi:tripartite-type tricarboxylate transporter receptor subunit TctC
MKPETPTIAVLLLVVAGAPADVSAQTVEEFYRSKSMTMLVGGGAGGGYDT